MREQLKMDRITKVIPAVFFILSLGLFAYSQTSDPVKTQLISEVSSVKPGEPFYLALLLQMEEHWHTYWKNPGDSGMPTQIRWDLPDGFVAGTIQWPKPDVFEDSGMITFGYEGEVLLIAEMRPPVAIRPGTQTRIRADVDWLVCRKSCIPGHADLTLELPVSEKDPKRNPKWAARFDEARKKLPKVLPEWKIQAVGKDQFISINVLSPPWFKDSLSEVFFFAEQEELVEYSAHQSVEITEQGFSLQLRRSKHSKKLPSQLKGVLVSDKGWDQYSPVWALQVDVPLRNK
jgi:thiol:disulfide interchange protein DsbD